MDSFSGEHVSVGINQVAEGKVKSRGSFAKYVDGSEFEPSYYQSKSGLWADDVIADYDLNFSLGNVFKYIVRAGKKGDRVQDLRKAICYLEREAERQTVEDWGNPITP